MTGDRRELGEQSRRDDLRALVLGPVVLSAECALAADGHGDWQVDWASPLHFVDADGEDVPLAEVLEQALDEHGVRGLRPALTAAGVPLHAQALATLDEVPDDDADTVIAVWLNLYPGWRLYDAFLTSKRLVLVRQRRRWGHSVRRGIPAQYPLFQAHVRRDTSARLSDLLRGPLTEVGTHVVRWDDLAAVRLGRGFLVGSLLRIPGLGQPWDRLKGERGSTAADVEEMAAQLRRLVGDRLETKVEA